MQIYDSGVTNGSTSITAPGNNWQYPVTAADYVNGSPSILTFMPAATQRAVIAGTNTEDLAPYINQALAHTDRLSFDGLPILTKTPVLPLGRKRIFMAGSLWTWAGTPSDPVITTGVDGSGNQIQCDLFIQDGRINAATTIFKLRLAAYIPLGLSVKGRNVLLDGQSRVTGSRAFDLRCVDFCDIQSFVVRNFDMVLNMEAIQGTAVGAITSGSNALTLTSSTEQLTTGMVINGTGIPVDTTVTKTGTNTYTMSANATATNAAVALTIRADKDNTQNKFVQMGIESVNSIGSIEDCDKIDIHMDTFGCGAGLMIGKDNNRVDIHHFHVEQVGVNASWKNDADIAAGKAELGVALRIKDNVNNGDILIHQFSCFRNAGGATPVAGIKRGRNVNGTKSNVMIRNPFIELPGTGTMAAWIPIEAHTQLDWEGEWFAAGSNIVLGDSGTDTSSDFVIRPQAGSTRLGNGARSLLPGIKAISLRNRTGTIALVEDPGTNTYAGTAINFLNRGHQVTFTGTGELYELVTLKIGWHTLIYTGAFGSGVAFASVRSDDLTQNVLQRQVNAPASYGRPLRMPFYVGTAGSYRVGVRSSGNADLIVESLGLFRGTYSEATVPRGLWDAPPIATANWPTASAFYEGEGYTRDYAGSGTDNTAHDCVKVVGGGYAWKARA